MDERSERLRQRRKRSSTGVNRDDSSVGTEATESAETSESDEPSKPSKLPADAAGVTDRDEETATDRDDGESEDRPRPVKEQQVGTYMYLPESQVKRLNRQYNVLKAEYEFEYSEEFEKNRHFYPLVVQYGLERLDELDTEQIRAHLQRMYE